MKRKLLIAGITLSLLCGCSAKEKTTSTKITTYSNTSMNEVFDTVYSFTEYTDSESKGKKHYSDSLDILTKCNQLFDIYNDYDGVNNLKTINDNAGIAPVKVDQLIIDMLKRAKDFYDLSNGEFDVTQGSLLKVWHKYREEGIALNEKDEKGNLPSDEELQEAASHAGWDKVEINEEDSTVYITDPDVSLDVGGIAKGYAAEVAGQQAEKDGMKAGFLNVGRNIRLVGNKTDGSDWRIGIADPSGLYTNGIVTVNLKNPVSVVTSGDYERYYIAKDGNRYAHIIDPSTLYPSTLYRSVSIMTEDSGDADCLSTSLFTMTKEEGMELISEYEKETGNEVKVIWVTTEDKRQGKDDHQVGDLYVSYTDNLEGDLTWPNS